MSHRLSFKKKTSLFRIYFLVTYLLSQMGYWTGSNKVERKKHRSDFDSFNITDEPHDNSKSHTSLYLCLPYVDWKCSNKELKLNLVPNLITWMTWLRKHSITA